MKRKHLLKTFLLAAILLFLCPAYVHAAQHVINVNPGKNGKDAGPAIRAALLEAEMYASKKNPFVIKVKPGKYKLSCELPIYSYTTLDLTDVTLTRLNKDYNMLRVGAQHDIAGDEGETGYYYTNIKLIGGTWNGAGQYSTVLKFAHAKNVTLQNVTVKNSRDGHLVEVAATNGFRCYNCLFKDMLVPKGEKTICYEAVQLDVLVPGHFNGYRAEALPVKNAEFYKCAFVNVPRGIGAHTSFYNAPHSGIKVDQCIFQKNVSCAMQFQYCSNISLSNNTITGSPRGIAIYGVMPEGGTGIFMASVPGATNGLKQTLSESYRAGLLKKYVIKNNHIVLSGKKDPLAGYEPLGIVVSSGSVINDKRRNDGSGSIPNGNYFVTKADVFGNTITDKSGKSYGIRFVNVQDSKIRNNTIQGKVNSTKNIYAITVKNLCLNVSITNNTITKSDGNAIYVTDSKVSSISANDITKTGKYGISIERSIAGQIDKNVILNVGHSGISLLNKGIASRIRNNTISGMPKYGILLARDSEANTVSGNDITKFRGYRAIHADSTSKITVLK